MPERYEPATFEAKWRQRWLDADLFRTREDAERPKFYGLDFFPYPSGAGLSVGHCRNYVPTDVICRFKFMQGFNVLHPMGFDAFGLPAENEAIKTKSKPGPMVEKYAANYKRQMNLVGISYDWSREVNSSDPSYYKWTQWIFKLLYDRGLAYRRLAEVNWCPKDKTALANEEVVGGLCERCGTAVEKRSIPQWFFKITDYAERLIDDLETLDWPEGIKALQRNWIGKSVGVEFAMKIATEKQSEYVTNSDFHVLKAERTPVLRVFTTRIDTIFGVTFAVVAPEHPMMDVILAAADPETRAKALQYIDEARRVSDIDRQAENREKTGVFSGAHLINPLNGEQIPVWIADYVLANYGTGAIMAVPGHDSRDFDFAQKFGLEIRQVIASQESEVTLPFEAKDGVLVNSEGFSGLFVKDAQDQIATALEANGIGERKVQYKLRDWLISRQRYWGCPIPIIHAADGELQTVPDEALPVYLPDVDHYEPGDDGASPLAAIPEFVNCADRDGRLGQRETDTMGGFACSSWYFLRFCDPHNQEAAWNIDRLKYWMPVDCYVGGAEHAVMHLLYARFWTKVLFDAGYCPVQEPFQRLYNQGQVLGRTPYRKPREGEHLKVGEEGILVSYAEAATLGEDEVSYRWARMSKSKGNVVTPDEAVEQYGADALRLYELFVAPVEQDVQWDNAGMQGQVRFLSRIFRLVQDWSGTYDPTWASKIDLVTPDEASKAIRRLTHVAIKKASDDIERMALNTYVSAMMIFVNGLNDWSDKIDSDAAALAASEAIESLILLISPAAPHSADELWESLGKDGFTYRQAWPKFREELCAADELTIAIQVNGKLRDTIMVAADADNKSLEAAAMASDKVQAMVAGLEIRRIIVVPGKLVNIVAN